jgi:hypothetical protein
MASLALQLGFDSPQIQRLMEDSPDRRLALAALLKARERDHYQYDSIGSLVKQIVACFNEAVPIEIRDRRASSVFHHPQTESVRETQSRDSRTRAEISLPGPDRESPIG